MLGAGDVVVVAGQAGAAGAGAGAVWAVAGAAIDKADNAASSTRRETPLLRALITTPVMFWL